MDSFCGEIFLLLVFFDALPFYKSNIYFLCYLISYV